MHRSDDGAAPRSGMVEIRVRYPECDPMGLAHHTAYPQLDQKLTAKEGKIEDRFARITARRAAAARDSASE